MSEEADPISRASLIVAHLQRGGLVVLTTHQAVELAAGTIRELRLD